ncbi:MAG: hypothetical protein Q8O40_16845 [Chloroflexota bacterium]|nr:hypothetical protein [Chloroflexota bacterium]
MVTRSGNSTIVLLALLAVALAGYLVPVNAQAGEGDCASDYVGVPPGPGAPVGFRVEGAVLRWENRAANANCLAIEIKPYLPPDLRTRVAEQWLPFATIYAVESTSYTVPEMESGGEVCFRMYAANQYGRSPYTGEVCLLPAVPPTPTPTAVWGIGATPERTPTASTGGPTSGGRAGRPAVVIMVTLLLVATVVGLMVLRWRVSGRS